MFLFLFVFLGTMNVCSAGEMLEKVAEVSASSFFGKHSESMPSLKSKCKRAVRLLFIYLYPVVSFVYTIKRRGWIFGMRGIQMRGMLTFRYAWNSAAWNVDIGYAWNPKNYVEYRHSDILGIQTLGYAWNPDN